MIFEEGLTPLLHTPLVETPSEERERDLGEE
jgi:hypothetical protein